MKLRKLLSVFDPDCEIYVYKHYKNRVCQDSILGICKPEKRCRCIFAEENQEENLGTKERDELIIMEDSIVSCEYYMSSLNIMNLHSGTAGDTPFSVINNEVDCVETDICLRNDNPVIRIRLK